MSFITLHPYLNVCRKHYLKNVYYILFFLSIQLLFFSSFKFLNIRSCFSLFSCISGIVDKNLIKILWPYHKKYFFPYTLPKAKAKITPNELILRVQVFLWDFLTALQGHWNSRIIRTQN